MRGEFAHPLALAALGRSPRKQGDSNHLGLTCLAYHPSPVPRRGEQKSRRPMSNLRSPAT
jgi:hypothetical protein